MKSIAIVFCLVFMYGCSFRSKPSIIMNYQTEVCPASLPEKVCPEESCKDSLTLKGLEKSFVDCTFAYEKCREEIRSIREKHATCLAIFQETPD